jgi:hypothetical protein
MAAIVAAIPVVPSAIVTAASVRAATLEGMTAAVIAGASA